MLTMKARESGDGEAMPASNGARLLSLPRPGGLRPWASVRHRSRYGLAEQLRRDDPDAFARRAAAEALEQVPPGARREIRDLSEGRV